MGGGTKLTENLWTGTKDFSGDWTNHLNYETDKEKYMGLTVRHCLGNWSGICIPTQVNAGEIYTFSCFVKGSDTNIVQFYGNEIGGTGAKIKEHGANVPLTAEWKHFFSLVTVTTSGKICLRLETSVITDGIYLCGFKLEWGMNQNPIWTPNSNELILTKSELKTYLDEYIKTQNPSS